VNVELAILVEENVEQTTERQLQSLGDLGILPFKLSV
jgi:hypothetical protein